MKRVKKQINNHGITLIALVITIIVLVILVGVSIHVVLNQGLISNAKTAVRRYNETQQNEIEYLEKVEEIQNQSMALQWSGQVADKIAEGEGTQENPYKINTPEELAYVAQKVSKAEDLFKGKYFIMTNSFDLGGIKNEDGTWSGLEWNPVGWKNNDSDITKSFRGYFDGQNHSIYNMNINTPSKKAVGLFGMVYEGSITNVHIKSGNVIGISDVGGIVGVVNTNSLVENCSNMANVKQNSTSYFTGAGGITGCNKGGIVRSCANAGEIIAGNQAAGGIAGLNQSNGSITNCSNSGKVTVKYQSGGSNSGIAAGGIVGTNTTGTMTECANTGEIIAECQQSGGIAGLSQSNGKVLNCSNSGKVTANSTGGRGIAGGIIGFNNASTIEECYNQGEVGVGEIASGVDVAGGIIGQYNTSTATTITRCYYDGESMEVGIGSSGTNNTVIVETADTEGSTEKVNDRLNTYEEFISWIAGKK